MVIEITPREKIRVSPFIVIGIVACVVLAIAIGAVYYYLDSRNKKLAEQIQEKKELLRPMEGSIVEMKKIIIPIKEKIDSFETLIINHQTPIAIYAFFEENSLPNVWLSDFKFDSESKEVSITGQTNSFFSLGQQANIFRESPLLKNLNLTSADIIEEGGGINFGMRFTFKGDIFRPILNKPVPVKDSDEAGEEVEEDVN